MEYLDRLNALIKNFNYEEAMKLSAEIQKAEDGGYLIRRPEERAWEELTAAIQTYDERRTP